MDRESIYELQKIDCNCNDCGFMIRDLERFKKSQEDHLMWQLNYFDTIKNNFLKKALEYDHMFVVTKKEKYLRKAAGCRLEADKMKFVFDPSEAMINYGQCSKYKKDVSFIPNQCQLETQECFTHRKDFVKEK